MKRLLLILIIIFSILVPNVFGGVAANCNLTFLAEHNITYYEYEEAAFNYADQINSLDFKYGTQPAQVAGILNLGQNFDDGNQEFIWTDNSTLFENNAFEMGYWLKLDQLGQWHKPPNILDFDGANSYGFDSQIRTTNILQFFTYGAGGTTDRWDTAAMVAGKWYFISYVWNGTDTKVYFNTTASGAHAVDDHDAVVWNAGKMDLMVGDSCYAACSGRWLDGTVDELSLFDADIGDDCRQYMFELNQPPFSAGAQAAPGIIDAILTSGVSSACNMTPLTPTCNTTDATYTMNLTTNQSATCDLNGTVCSTTGTTAHICTMASPQPQGLENFTANCSTSGTFGPEFTRQVLVDLINPAVVFGSPTSQTYTNLSSRDMNVTCTDDYGIANITMYVDGTINVTNSSVINNSAWITAFTPATYKNYSINFTCYDRIGDHNSNTTETRWFNFAPPTTTLELAGFNRSITAELGSIIDVEGNVTGATVCVDVNHPSYGYNYSCGTGSTSFDLNITWFRRTTFNDSSRAKNYSIGSIGGINETQTIPDANSSATPDADRMFTNLSDTFDGNFSTFGYINATGVLWGRTDYNYRAGATNFSLVELTTGNATYKISTNYSIPESCWKPESNSIGFYYYSVDFGGGPSTELTGLYCVSPFIVVDSFMVGKRIYDIRMHWNIDDGEFITGHQYDEIVNFTINITGYADTDGNLPDNVQIYINDTLSNDIGSLGFTVTAFNDSDTQKNATFSESETITVGYLKIPEDATITSAHITMQGLNYTYLVESATNQTVNGTMGGKRYSSWIVETYNSTNRTFINWQVKHGIIATYNVTNFSTSCVTFNDTFIQIGMESYNDPNSPGGYLTRSNVYCYNGTWVSVGNTTQSVSGVACVPLHYGDDLRINMYDGNYDTRCAWSEDKGWGSNYGYDATSVFGCRKSRIYENGIYFKSYPKYVWMEIGTVNGTRNFEQDDVNLVFNTTNTTVDLTTDVQDFIDNACTLDAYGFCNVPITIYSEYGGIINVLNINISYTRDNLNPVNIDLDVVEAFLNASTGAVDIPLRFTGDGGIIQVNDIKYDYAGGNATYLVTARNVANTTNVNYNITYYYSDWFLQLPPYIDYIEFIPTEGPTQKNVSAYGQTTNRPIINITATNYGGKELNFTVAINETFSCGNDTLSLTNDISTGVLLVNNTWTNYTDNIEYLEEFDIFAWADFECSYSTWYLWNPYWLFRGCCEDCDVCDESVTNLELV